MTGIGASLSHIYIYIYIKCDACSMHGILFVLSEFCTSLYAQIYCIMYYVYTVCPDNHFATDTGDNLKDSPLH